MTYRRKYKPGDIRFFKHSSGGVIDALSDMTIHPDDLIGIANGQDATIAAQQQQIEALTKALEAFMIAHENLNGEADGNVLIDRMEKIGEAERWYSGEDLQEWAMSNARALLTSTPEKD